MTKTEEEQNEALQQLLKELGDLEINLETENAAKEQLVNTLSWRKENNVDLHPVATEDNKLPLLYPVRGFSCLPDGNLEAHPDISSAVLRIYRWMGGKVSHYHTGCNEFLHRVIMKDCSKKAGKHINRETVIFDCTGMGWHQFHMPALYYIKAISDTDQKYYPETLNKLYLVNAPSAFVMVWKVVKGWLDPGTIDKIQILGKDYKEVLLKQIPAENLPSFLGGQCTCSHIPGGCVPSQSNSDNENVSTAYSTAIMEKGKTDKHIRGPAFFQESE
ncbi:CRAL-TRIO domain-containing protein [Circinella umbellata]|nr:CRAL-TRIO domain-containing protein [Circinella umbellata]